MLLYHVGLTVVVANGGSFSSLGFSGVFGPEGRVVEGARLGVFIFFVLSGYLISRSFVAAYIGGVQRPPFFPYMRNRLLRIVPLFWLVATAVLIRYGDDGGSIGEWVAVYGFAQNYVDQPYLTLSILAPAWTLHVEMGFYLLVPVVAALLARATPASFTAGRRLWIVLGLAVAVLGASLYLRDVAPEGVKNTRQLWVNMFAFMPGVALAAIEPFARRALADRVLVARLAPLLLVPAAAAFVAHQFADAGETAAKAGLIAVISGGVVAAPLVVQWTGARPWRVLDNTVMHSLGRWSYSIYLLQVPLLVEIDALADEGSAERALVLLGLAALALTVAVSALTYRFVERPFLRRRKPTVVPVEPQPTRRIQKLDGWGSPSKPGISRSKSSGRRACSARVAKTIS